MSEHNSTNSKSLRLAGLIRVSTEKQEQEGESLRTQRLQCERDAERLGGRIAGWYGGQEHATPGWERKELERLLTDAGKDKYDGVIVAYTDRWSRDNGRSKEGLETFRKHGIRFFVGTMEMNLFDPNHCFILGMSAEVGEFIAKQGTKKSIENRIERARRGIPTAGKLPFGRTYDRKAEKWGIDDAKQARIADIAVRYLKGESLMALAKEHRMSHSNLALVLREQCGEDWSYELTADDLNIRETITMKVPRLLDEATIKAVRERLTARRTYLHGNPRHDYLLNGRVFCAECGYNMTGQVGHSGGHLYYRHGRANGAGKCPLRPRPWVRADNLEEEVIRQLFQLFGNPSAIERAVAAAVPDCESSRKSQESLTAELGRVAKARSNILALVEKEALTLAQAEKKLLELKEREVVLRGQLDQITEALADVPDPAAVRCYIDKCTQAREQVSKGEQVDDFIFVSGDDGNQYAGGNSIASYLGLMGAWEDMSAEHRERARQDRRNLVRAVFDTPPLNGKPAGVYISLEGAAVPHRPKQWTFTIRGRLDFELVMRNVRGSPGESRNELAPPPAPIEIRGTA